VKASIEVTGKFDHDGIALDEARKAIDETPNVKTYGSRIVGFNRDPTVTLSDVQKLLQLVEERLTKAFSQKANP
jgi:hypothetical protein